MTGNLGRRKAYWTLALVFDSTLPFLSLQPNHCSRTPALTGRGEHREPRSVEREVRGHSGWNPGILLPGPNHLWNRVSHMAASAAHRCLTCLARRQLSIEEADDLGIHHLV